MKEAKEKLELMNEHLNEILCDSCKKKFNTNIFKAKKQKHTNINNNSNGSGGLFNGTGIFQKNLMLFIALV
jgi:hypothetical protein